MNPTPPPPPPNPYPAYAQLPRARRPVICTSRVTANNHDNYISYTLTAIPQTLGKTGDQGYCSDESGIIKYDPTGGTGCTQPLP